MLVAGGWDGGAFFTGIDAYVLRLRSDGTSDPSFNGGNSVFHFGYGDASDKPEAVSRIALQPDGKIVLPGIAANSTDQDAALARVSPGAVLDPDFGSGGTIVFGRGNTNDTANDVALEQDGHALVAGSGLLNSSMLLVRSSSGGPFEKWFNGQTTLSVDFGKPSAANAIALQANGRIVLGGSAGDDVAVARVEHGGASDSSFGPDGKRTISFPGGDAEAFAMALQGDGRIVLAGHSGKSAAVIRVQGDPAAQGGGPGGPNGPNTTGRAPRMRKFSAKVKKGGRSVSFVLRSDQNSTGLLSGKTAKAYAAAKKRRVSLGSVRFKLTAGKSKTVVLKLSRKARTLLARRHSLRVQFTIALTNSAKQRGVSRRTVTLRTK